MAATTTGELYTGDEVRAMSAEKREELGIVELTNEDQQAIQGMNREQRRAWLKKNKRFKK